jgi:hypothetical protein
LGEFFHEDERLTWVNQARRLIGCSSKKVKKYESRGYTTEEKKIKVSELRDNLDIELLEGIIIFFRMLGYDIKELSNIQDEEGWICKSTLIETVMTYWPKNERDLFIHTFCQTVGDIRRSKWAMEKREIQLFEQSFCKNAFREIMRLEKKEAIEMAKFRNISDCDAICVAALGLVNTIKLIEHIDAKTTRQYWDNSECKGQTAGCKCKLVDTQIYFSAFNVMDHMKRCRQRDIKTKYMNWIGVMFNGSFPTDREVADSEYSWTINPVPINNCPKFVHMEQTMNSWREEMFSLSEDCT